MADFDTNDCTSLYSIKGIVILDQDGNRIIAKYYDKNNFGTAKEQKAFEKSLFQKTHRNSSSEILLLDGVTCVYRSNVDLHFYVLGSSRENELVLESLLNCFYDAISTVLRKNVEKKTLIDSMDTCILILDEICDEGIILETDPTAVISRCALRGDEVYFSDQSFSQVGKSFMESAKEQIKWSLLKMRRLTIHKSPARSHVEKAAKPVLEGKENDAFADETEVLRRSAAENYFMQGKCGIMNKYRKGRRKITTHAEEDSSSDDEENDSAGIMAKFSLESLSKFVEETSKEKAKNLEKIKENFSYWTNVYLESEFNICMIGAGAKNAVLNSYERQLASDGECTFLVEGFNEEASIRGILQSLSDALKIKKTPRDIVNWAREITKHLEKKESRVFMFLHNIDASNLRDSADQKALAVMSSTPWLRLVTTVDHLNATLMWDSFCSKKFNFVFVEVNTFDFSLSNLMASKSRILGLDPKHNASTHTMSSLDILWQSLAENARKIFRIFFAMHYETGQSVPFWDLFNTARDDFLVSSDAALRLLLVEFEDHRVLTRRRREDGNENLIPCLDRDLVEKFLTEKGISLEL